MVNKEGLVVEITDKEVRLLRFPIGRNFEDAGDVFNGILNRNEVIYDRIPLEQEVVTQGVIQRPAELASTLREHLGKLGRRVSELPAFLSLPTQFGFIRHFSLPWIAVRYRQEAIRHLVEEEVPFPAGDKLYDFQTLEESPQENRWHILIGAARHSIVESYTAPLLNAGLRVQGVGLALVHLGHMLKSGSDEQVIYVEVEQGQIQLVVFNGKIPEVVRTFTTDSDISEQAALVRRVLMYYALQQNRSALTKIIANGGEARLLAARLVQEGLVPLWEEASAFSSFADAQTNSMEAAKTNEAVSPTLTLLSYAAACSMKGNKLNLWHEYEQKKRKFKFWRTAMAAGILSLILLVFSLIPLHRQELAMAKEVGILRQEGQSIQMEQEKRASIAQDWQNVLFHPVQVGNSLAKIQTSFSPRIAFTSLEYRQGGLNLKGRASAPGEVEDIMKGLKDMGWRQPLLTSYRQEGENIEFTLSTSLSSK